MGGELKNTFCLASGRTAWVSQHIGDMGSLETLTAFERSTRQFGDLYAVDPVCIVADAHPGYQTRRWAEEQDDRDRLAGPASPCPYRSRHGGARRARGRSRHRLRLRRHRLRHRRRHLGRRGPPRRLRRVRATGCTCATCPCPGATPPSASRTAPRWPTCGRPGSSGHRTSRPSGRATGSEREVMRSQLEEAAHCVPSSSMGRLFDAVSSLIGVRHEASYEAQAAMELEWVASGHLDAARPYSFAVGGRCHRSGAGAARPHRRHAGRPSGRSDGRRVPPRRGRSRSREVAQRPPWRTRASTGSRSAAASSRTSSCCVWPRRSWWRAASRC